MSHKIKSNEYIKIGPFYYRFKFSITIFTIVAVFILTHLCIWQLERSFEKEHLFLELERKTQKIPVPLNKIDEPQLEKDRFTPVYIQGTYLNHFTFLLDNQIMNKQAGYRVITAFQSPYLNELVLVDRGWVPRNKDRNTLPPIKEIYGVMVVKGIINNISTGIVLHKDTYTPNATWPIVIQKMDYDFISQNLQMPVYEFVVRLQSSTTVDSYTMPPLDFGMPSNKHLGYAIQWFIFMILVIVYYIIHSFKLEK